MKNKQVRVLKPPVKPVEPKYSDFEHSKGPTTSLDTPYILALKKHKRDMEKYEQELEEYEQLRLLRDIRRSTDKLCLKKYKIIKR